MESICSQIILSGTESQCVILQFIVMGCYKYKTLFSQLVLVQPVNWPSQDMCIMLLGFEKKGE